jgi:uncharacterized protein with PIN domain
MRRRDLPPHFFVRADDFRSQLRQVAEAFGLDPYRALLSRCSRCNEMLQHMTVQDARPFVPPYVAATQTDFAQCPQCKRFYWPATHVERLRQEIEGLKVT